MQFKSAISTLHEASAAIKQLRSAVAGFDPDLVLFFSSLHYGPDFEKLLAEVRESINTRNLIGCVVRGIIGPDREVEDSPAMAIWAAKLPGVKLMPFVIDQNDVQSLEGPEAWREQLSVPEDAKPCFIILPDPFSVDVEQVLGQLNESYPDGKTVGGLASAGSAPGENRLFLNDQVLRQGLVGVSLSGPIVIETVVSQGCRPVGDPFVVTRADRNIIYELRGKPALDIVRHVFASAPAADQVLMQNGLHLGRVVDERLAKFGPGDFLIRNLMGVAENEGLAVGSLIRAGQTIQFHVRDSKSADLEMKQLLTTKISAMPKPPMGGLLFTCNGRGTGMFGTANHDIGVVNSVAQGCEIAGFFAAGEIGPVGNRSFIHGFTSSLVLFRQP